MGGYNKLKSEKLEMSYSKATHMLRKKVMFYLAEKCGMRNCYRCGKYINNIENFTIEHKVSWQRSDNPRRDFFDMDNIAFSHSKCNSLSRASFSFRKIGISGYRGVSLRGASRGYEVKTNKWVSVVVFKKTKYHIGVFETAKEAAKAYDRKVVELFGCEAITNKQLGLL